MLVMNAHAPDGADQAACDFARLGLAAQRIEGRCDVAAHPLRVFTARDASIESLDPASFELSSWRYLILHGEEVVALVSVHVRGGVPVARSMEFTRGNAAFREALRMAGQEADRDGAREVHLIDIPWIHASFLWVTGDDPVFVDRIEPRAYGIEDFVRELRRRWRSKADFDPSPTDTPSGSDGP